MTHDRPAAWCNPILDRGCADPFILVTDYGYYLYGTGKAEDGRFVPVYHSPDLVTWRFVRGAVEQGQPGAWNRRNFWAPEVLSIVDRSPPAGDTTAGEGARPTYYLYYTAMPDGTPGNTGNRVGLAAADSPEGPFEDRGVVVTHASLDGSPFVDWDGALYLYDTAEFGSDAAGLVPGRIYGVRLTGPDRVDGEPVELVGRHCWQEGPCVLVPPALRQAQGPEPGRGASNGPPPDLPPPAGERAGVRGAVTQADAVPDPHPTPLPGRERGRVRYYLFYSVGNWGDATYHVRWAVGDSPLGPFEEAEGRLLESTDAVIGPGHHNFFRGPGGGTWIVYHGWDPAHTARYPRIDRLSWDGDQPRTDGPTVTRQPLHP